MQLERLELPAASPEWVAPMLATREKEIPGPGWLAERKVDGYRVAITAAAELTIYSRRGHDVTDRYRHLVARPGRECVVDGEAVAFHNGRDDFGRLQQEGATHVVVFDLLQVDGHDVRGLDLITRRRLLAELDLGANAVLSPALPAEQVSLARACEAGWEGVIAKQVEAPYQSGRTRQWLKVKCSKGQEFVIAGYTKPRGTRTGFGALLLGYWDDGHLRYAGKVGTGFSDDTLRKLHGRLKAIPAPEPPFSDPPRDGIWVQPELVCQVDFTEWTSDGQLRHPRFLGLRDDKPPREVVRES